MESVAIANAQIAGMPQVPEKPTRNAHRGKGDLVLRPIAHMATVAPPHTAQGRAKRRCGVNMAANLPE
jgi:hypothetical protein